MRRLLRTASFRLTAIYVALFTTSAALLGAAVYLTAQSALEQQMADRIQTDVAYLQGEFRDGGLERLLTIVAARGRGPIALDYLVQDGRGAHLAGEIPALADLRPGWTTIKIPVTTEDEGRSERTRAFVTDLGGGLLLGVGDDLRRIGEVEEAITTAFLWSVGLVALLGIGGGILLSRAFLARVDAISRTAEAIISGDLARRVPVRGTNDDLDRLATTLNRMLDRIGTLMESLRQVSTDVAHDLRTPLTRLYQRLEEARLHARSMPEFRAANEAAIREAEALLDTFSALLRIAQVEGASPRAGFGALDLSAVAAAVVDAYRPDAEEGGHRIVAAIIPTAVVEGDQELLTQALANLMENGLRHTPTGTCITVVVDADSNEGFRITVEDDGPGVRPHDMPRLADRFYRAEPSRTTPGNGLGLSLVAAVADLHEATLQIEAADPGLRVRMTFKPVAAPRRHQTGAAGGAPAASGPSGFGGLARHRRRDTDAAT
ncbi:MAG: ATP-binding protein [Pseudomonadota bacterium]|nr:ATP-binding protein [Pseudomonadota bacterium]